MSDKLYPTLLTNQESLLTIVNYCISKKLPFGVHPQDDMWNTEIEINSLNDAISLGMFLQKNEIFPIGFENESIPQKEKQSVEKVRFEVEETVNSSSESAPVIEFMVNSPENNVATETIDSKVTLTLDDDSFESAQDLFESVDNSKKQETEMLFN